MSNYSSNHGNGQIHLNEDYTGHYFLLMTMWMKGYREEFEHTREKLHNFFLATSKRKAAQSDQSISLSLRTVWTCVLHYPSPFPHCLIWILRIRTETGQFKLWCSAAIYVFNKPLYLTWLHLLDQKNTIQLKRFIFFEYILSVIYLAAYTPVSHDPSESILMCCFDDQEKKNLPICAYYCSGNYYAFFPDFF